MPKREDIKSILVIGSGPIIIGQACEFDYSGTQACRVLRAEGLRVILVNSNPATIMPGVRTNYSRGTEIAASMRAIAPEAVFTALAAQLRSREGQRAR